MTTPAPAEPAEPAGGRIPRSAFDIVRLGSALIAGVNAIWITVLVVVLARGHEPLGDLVAQCLFAFSAVSSIAYTVHTIRVFGRADAARLRGLLAASTPRGRLGQVEAALSGTGPTLAVQWSVIAIAAVLAFTLWPGLLREPATVFFSVLVVAASWSVTVVAYAVHYARYDASTQTLGFPGDSTDRLFADYLYLAVQVQTTFSTSDVSLLDTGSRRIVTGHTLVSFAFNTVIIAMLITVLFLGAGA